MADKSKIQIEGNDEADIGLRNDHNVYILGAGFSREAGLPLISDFLVRMRDSHEWLLEQGRRSEAEAVAKVLKFRLRAASAAYYVHMDLENIEELFSLASATEGDMDTAIQTAIAATIDFTRRTPPKQPGKTFFNIHAGSPKLFVPATKDTPPKHPDWAKPGGDLQPQSSNSMGPFKMTQYGVYVARLLGLFLTGTPQGQNTFITLNYDTVLEEAMQELGFSPNYCLACELYEHDPGNNPSFPVLKLHGSVNWTLEDDGAVAVHKNYEAARLTALAPPLLTPPTWKKAFGGPMEHVWNAAIRSLSIATRVIIIGFSIPPTDIHFKYLLAAGLRNNFSLRELIFVNPDPDDQLRRRARNLLRKDYITSGIIGFSKATFGEFANLSPPWRPQGAPVPTQIGKLGRPAEPGLSVRFE